MNRLWAVTLLTLLGLSLTACKNRFEKIYDQAEAEIVAKNFRSAIVMVDEAIKSTTKTDEILRASHAGAKVSFFELKDFETARAYYQKIIYFSEDSGETLDAQRKIAEILAEHQGNYEGAIVEFNKLLQIDLDVRERQDYRFKLARCYYHLKLFYQAKAELEIIIKETVDPEQEFEIKLLRANVLIADKHYTEALEALNEQMKKFRERSIRENIPMLIAVAYEELKDFKSALSTLEGVRAEHPIPEFVDFRIKAIKDRARNQPKTKSRGAGK